MMTSDNNPDNNSAPIPAQCEQSLGSATPLPSPTVQPTRTSGRRQALDDIRRDLTVDELSSPGVQKLILDRLDTAMAKCEELSGYVERFYLIDKQAAIYLEKLNSNIAIDVAYGVGVGLGAAILGLAPTLWKPASPAGWISLTIGGVLIVSGIIVKLLGTKRGGNRL